MKKLSLKLLSFEEMQVIEGGVTSCAGLSFACGAGLAVSIFTGGLGAILFGPSTVGLCAGAYVSCN